MKRTIKWICLFLCVVLVFGMFAKPALATYASELTNSVIKEKEQEIDKAKQEKKQLQNSLTDVKKLKEQLEKSKQDLTVYVQELDADLTAIQEKINELNDLITEKEKEIEDKTAELEEAQRVQQEQYEAMKTRIKFMYERGDTIYMELIFSSNSFGDVLNKADYIQMLSEYDRKLLDEYVAHANYVALCKESLEEEKEVLDEAKAAVEKEEASLNELIDAKENEMYKMSSVSKARNRQSRSTRQILPSRMKPLRHWKQLLPKNVRSLRPNREEDMMVACLPGRRHPIQEFRMIMETVRTRFWALSSSIMELIWQHPEEAQSLQPMMARWWQQPIAAVWGIIL